ncbi:MAG: sulfite exporter TauE/SafE family protein [Syntrophaceae bacterium]|nr:sulfite exporter TauE/SafE family protein [Syntrophaceae bacterium]
MSIMQFILVFLIGLSAGLTTSLTGASAVMIIVPVLNMFLHFSMSQSIGTSLMVDTLASAFISYTYYRHGNTDIKSGIWVILGSVLGAQVGVAVAVLHVPDKGLGCLFGICLVIMGIVMWRHGLKKETITNMFGNVLKFKNYSFQVLLSMVLGFIVGIITGMLGTGGGIMILLILIFVLKFNLQKAIGTATFMMAVTAFSGTIGYGYHGEVNLLTGLVLASGAVTAGVVGARFANRIEEKILTKVAALVFILLGIVMIGLHINDWDKFIR